MSADTREIIFAKKRHLPTDKGGNLAYKAGKPYAIDAASARAEVKAGRAKYAPKEGQADGSATDLASGSDTEKSDTTGKSTGKR